MEEENPSSASRRTSFFFFLVQQRWQETRHSTSVSRLESDDVNVEARRMGLRSDRAIRRSSKGSLNVRV